VFTLRAFEEEEKEKGNETPVARALLISDSAHGNNRRRGAILIKLLIARIVPEVAPLRDLVHRETTSARFEFSDVSEQLVFSYLIS